MAAPATASFPSGLLTVELPAGARVIRVHRNTQGAIFFGPPAARRPAIGTTRRGADARRAFRKVVSVKPKARKGR